jgi:tRNA(Ile)-lysidine synthase
MMMNFPDRFMGFIQEHDLISDQDTLLVAVSGGVDSVVLCDVLHRAGYKFHIAHVNFQLRGKESEADHEFVKTLARNYACTFHDIAYNTSEYSRQNGISVEMAARKLRFSFFKHLSEKFGYSKIALGTHQNDLLETMILNLVKGTGIRGLHGILPQRNAIIRPLLFATKSDIEEYAEQRALKYRLDHSNLLPDFQRNLIRLRVVPELKKINPALEHTMHQNSLRFYALEKLLEERVSYWKSLLIKRYENTCEIAWKEIKNEPYSKLILYEILKSFDLQNGLIENILANTDNQPGRMFDSADYEILIDRDAILVREKKEKPKSTETLVYSQEKEMYFNSVKFHFSTIDKKPDEDLKNPQNACLDFDKLHFPLRIRKWFPGDAFVPYGSKKLKKLSDFFIDQKLNRFQKEDVLLFESREDIVWIYPLRTDMRYAVTEKTKKIFKIISKKS